MSDMKDIINVAKYPIFDQNDKMAQELQEEYYSKGRVLLPNFLTPAALDKAVSQVDVTKAYPSDNNLTVYFDHGDVTKLDKDHPRNKVTRSNFSAVNPDKLPASKEGGVIASLYECPEFKDFVRRILGLSGLFPIGGVGSFTVNVAKPGNTDSYHYDENNFTTTLLLQSAEKGGIFECTEPTRTGEKPEENEHMNSQLASIMETGSSHSLIHQVNLEPGTLLIFNGNRSLHRVTPNEGQRDRFIAVLAYSEYPGMKNSEKMQEMFWGRSA